ncbi:serine hydrolase [Gluconobacter cerinus]|uniref:serine hydrolase n=1 Tax=Gluconobacter TaxID=441 RepID=UPI001B8C3B59|nr:MULTISPECIES: serine hydrolase [Gluconobacter]MBS0994327.1 serine hydrolase [Gluconobacter cerinus]MBS1022287.1 serine hydrolase [Gluconobacter cerinus]
MNKRRALYGTALLAGALMLRPAYKVQAAELPSGLTAPYIDATVEQARKAFDVPGIAVAVVQDGKIVFNRGYGRRAEDVHSAPVDSSTLFAIGSNTKEFTATALAQLVDAGKLKWDDRVIDHLPEFRVSDPWITRDFRVSDLLTHHSGMGLGAGDLMLFSHSTFTRKDVLAGLVYMPFTAPFRKEYAYNNLLYVVAGALVERVTGHTWEDVVQTRLIDASGLAACQSTPPYKGETDVATGQGDHGPLPEKAARRFPAVGPAGSIWCSAEGMARWAQIYLGGGQTPEGKRIFSSESRDKLWAPHALLPLPDMAALTGTHFRAYGYGWFMEDFFGHKRVWHTGTIGGMVSYVTFLPELKSAVVILTNHDDHNATYALATTLSARIATGHSADWISYWKHEEDEAKAHESAVATSTGPGSPARPFVTLQTPQRQDYMGDYLDNWRGPISVTERGQDLRLIFSKADGLAGTLKALPHDLFVVRWDNREEDSEDDAYVQFERDVTGKVTGMKMQLLGSDFSFDAQDLHPRKVETAHGEAHP